MSRPQAVGDPDLAELRSARRSGTTLAIIDNAYSYALASEAKHSWGGARNRADRESIHLSDRQAAELMAAARYALATGRTFQRHWIIHYGKAGIAERDGARFVARILDLLRRQVKRAGGELTAIWVREWASSLGGHVHILLHLPVGFSMRNRTTRLIRLAGGQCLPSVTRIRHVGGRLGGDSAEPEHRAENAANVVRYLLKSASEETGARLGLKYSGRLGRIIGKRCGSTQNIGRAARAKLKTGGTIAPRPRS